jgi:ferrous iron transport protein A
MIRFGRIENEKNIETAAIVPLGKLSTGAAGRVVEIRFRSGARRRRLFDMGITVGTVIEIKQIAPLGDPVDVALRDYRLCLRRADLDHIMVEVIK